MNAAGKNDVSVFEVLEKRQMMSAAVASVVRSYDGVGNNVANAEWGSSFEAFLRTAKAGYGDGISTMAGASRPSARAVSNGVAAHGEGQLTSERNLSAFAYLWGQFIDHDIDLTRGATSELANVAVPAGDPWFDPSGTGTLVIPFTRSAVADGTGVTNARQQVNDITAFIDGSMVYGSDATRAIALRELSGGRMKVSAGEMLPYNTMGLDNATFGGPAENWYVAGDIRVNENVELIAIQTLFVREHNRIAGQIAKKNPAWTDEQIYQRARAAVIGEIQAITYKEFLPALLGEGAIRPYAGYNPKVNPGIANEFATAAFRLGHSMVADDVEFMDNDGNEVREEMSLAEAFFNIGVVEEEGIDPILKYLASSNSEEIDTKVVDGLRNFLFGPPGAGGLDLASLNIQRGRDHGLADYNTVRAAYGLPRVKSFAQITSDVDLQGKLKALYGSVDNVDLWVGGLAEDHAPGASVGATFQRIIADQFTRLRDGDRFWYQRDLKVEELKMVEGVTLAEVIRRNSGTTNLQGNVFFFDVAVEGRVWDDRNGDGRVQPGENGIGGRMVTVLDDDGNVVGKMKTRPDGSYRIAGLGLGTLTVRVELPGGWKGTTKLEREFVATRGIRFEGVSFGEQKIGAGGADQSRPMVLAQHRQEQGGVGRIQEPSALKELLA